MATLALDTVGGYDSAVADGIDVLGGGAAASGAVYFKIGDSASGSGFYYSGETLEAMRLLGGPGGFQPGDANADGALQLADTVFILSYLFAGGQAPTCFDAADANDDGTLDISDAMKVIMYLFGSQPPPPAPVR